MSGSLRVGVAGAGFMGETHLAAWAADGVPTSVFDVHHDRALEVGARHGAAVARSLDELIAASDVVDICTATHLHAEIAIAAARAGRHVICEKPLARTLADADRVIEACAAAGVQLLVAHVVRYFPEYAAAHERVTAGAVGKPAVLRLRRGTYRPRHPAGHWLFDHARSGGLILDLMIHDLDFARWVAGDVTSVWCRSVGVDRPELGVDHAVAILGHASGAISHVSGSWAYGRPDFRTAFEIAGSTGLISHDSALAPVASWLDSAGDTGGAVGLPRSPVAVDPYRAELREFRRRIEDGTPTRVSAHDGREALRIALAADASARSGRVVALEAVG